MSSWRSRCDLPNIGTLSTQIAAIIPVYIVERRIARRSTLPLDPGETLRASRDDGDTELLARIVTIQVGG